MNAKDIMKSILEKIGPITISESDLKNQDKQIGMIETWDDKGNRSYIIYTHDRTK